MKKLLLILPLFMVGCMALKTNVTPTKTVSGARGYFLKTGYGGIEGSRETAIETTERNANALCPSGYSVTDEYEGPVINTAGKQVIGGVKLLTWEIECKNNQAKS
jgi:hypothetical protein